MDVSASGCRRAGPRAPPASRCVTRWNHPVQWAAHRHPLTTCPVRQGRRSAFMTRADTTVPPGHPLDPSGRTVLSSSDVSRALRRIAHEILERNKGADDLVLLGIPSRGVPLAQRLVAAMAEGEGARVPVGSLDVTMHRDDLRPQPVRPLARTDIPAGGID